MTTPPRKPLVVPPPRIGPMASLPLFFKLDGRKVVVAGTSDGADWKAELLVAAGAQVLRLEKGWSSTDLAGAALALIDATSDQEARAFREAAHAEGAIVNVIDRPEFCDVQFGAIVNRSPLLVAISTDGAAPVFGQAIRMRIETLLPPSIQNWAEAARDWRPLVQARTLGFAARRRLWEWFALRALTSEKRPSQDDRDAMLALADNNTAAVPRGRVILIGAGPGDPDLLTLKAMRALQSADVILHDDLVPGAVIERARREAQRIAVGKRGAGPSCRQKEISALMVRLAAEGKTVIRLKNGDPMIFGRATEEIAACRAAGIAVEIVPGITAAQGAAASLQVSLTERHLARRLQFLTGHGADGRLPADIEWRAVADRSVTTVLYMPRRTLGAFCEAAIAAGLDPLMPALAIQSVSRPTERHVRSSIRNLAAELASFDAEGPVLVMIGEVLRDIPEIAPQLLDEARRLASAA
jgi:uroporphyrin-III C-methyltransferase / precorrin-2 dehydrogenase / sirohydrochlorin ferrochelatase